MRRGSDPAALAEASAMRKAKWSGIYARVLAHRKRDPDLTPTEIANLMGIGRETVVRALKSKGEKT